MSACQKGTFATELNQPRRASFYPYVRTEDYLAISVKDWER